MVSSPTLTPAQQRTISSALWQGTPAGFAWKLSEGKWTPARHLRLISQKLLDAAAGRCPRLIITAPPRHGKSELASKWFPAWYLNAFPDRKIMLASYEATFAAEWGQKVRDVLVENAGALKVQLQGSSPAAARWQTTEGGGMWTAGIGGGFTGRGANGLLIDDPTRNWEDAFSRVYREKVWNFFQSVAYTRLEPKGFIVVIMTRWHPDDLVGRLKEAERQGGEHWEEIVLPAMAESESDLLGRDIGEALWPDRFTEADFARMRKGGISDYVWGALYQGRPNIKGSSIIDPDWFALNRFDIADWRRLRDTRARFISWDTAISDKDDAAYSVGVVGELTPDYKLQVVDVIRERMRFPELVDNIKRTAQAYNHDGRLRDVIIEAKASGTSAYQTLMATAEPWLRERLRTYTPHVDKLTRASLASAWCENGSVELPAPSAGTMWLSDFEEELFSFPVSAYADQVDAFSQLVLWTERILEQGHRGRIAAGDTRAMG